MSSQVISFTLFFFTANLVAGAVYMFGQKRLGLLWQEYPFIYTPWLAMMLLMPEFMSLPGIGDGELALKYFLFMVQGFSCGVFGGAILFPRLWIKVETTAEKLKVTAISSLVLGAIYLFLRWLLLQGFVYILH
jgi:hypothetical protein